jgi:hypothetical protein
MLPTEFNRFLRVSKTSHRLTELHLLNKFSYRYRLARSFTGLTAPNVGRTLAGYSVITKVFLSYTAYEAILNAAIRLRVSSVSSFSMNMVFDKDLAKRIRNNDKLRNYLLSYPHDHGLANKVQLFFDGTTSDIVCVAFALRNVFAHGELTASVVGTETIAKRKVFTDLAESLLDYCDDKFTLCLAKL